MRARAPSDDGERVKQLTKAIRELTRKNDELRRQRDDAGGARQTADRGATAKRFEGAPVPEGAARGARCQKGREGRRRILLIAAARSSGKVGGAGAEGAGAPGAASPQLPTRGGRRRMLRLSFTGPFCPPGSSGEAG